MRLPLSRRVAICIIALSIAAVLFRCQIGSALVLRGDEAAQAGNTGRAIALYRRALVFNASDGIAADRLAFALLARRGAGDARAAVDIATAALRRTPNDPALLVDRALGERRLARLSAAESDFSRAADAARDARYAHFAGTVALARGHRRSAIAHFRTALKADAAFRPARSALRKLGVP
ncbi:MAG: hypothetical protein ABR591_10965 [Candidatus Velthaea sp.]